MIRDSGFNGILFKLGRGFNNIKLHESVLEVGASILDVNLAKLDIMIIIPNVNNAMNLVKDAKKININVEAATSKFFKWIRTFSKRCRCRTLTLYIAVSLYM